ncbi:MAG TPA: dienelactone hydrolase family protein [Candidatus Acidoferrales bacterium]|nr:dienelactone hydrolase family protein [Candidatus Acidoferrales bacterium]
MQVNEQWVEVPGADGTAGGFLYSPEGQGPWPGVIHLTDIVGIRAATREMAKRQAARGFCVLEPNVFYRTGDPPLFDFPFNFGEERTMKRLRELSGPLTPEAMEHDASAYVDFLPTQPRVTTGGMGVVGYCFTGSMALRAAAARPDRIAAAASFHGGGLCTDTATSPHTVLPRVKARLYFGHADEDRSMPKEAIEKLERALTSWGGTYASETYTGASHGWTVPDSRAYNEPQAERAFEKLAELFSASLK